MRGYRKIVLLLVIIFLSFTLTSCVGGNNTEKVRTKMEQALLEEYGEEFVVDRIGTRNYPNRGTYYEARIYPKSIVGINKEGDSYYYAKAGMKKKSFGRLGKVGAGYETVQIKLEAEDYLMPKAKEIFGDRVLLKPEVKYKWRSSKEIKHYSWEIVSGFKDLLKKTKNDPEHNMIELTLYVYVFDRIDNQKEKEERRKEIFDFVQYLKQEGLFRYLEMGVIFIDERVLAPSYREYRREVFLSDKVKEDVQGETVYLPPMELRMRMSRELEEEVNRMSEEELLANMRKIRKSNLNYDALEKYNGYYGCFIKSPKMLEEYYKSYLSRGGEQKYYRKLEDVYIGKYRSYIYIN